MNGPEYSASCPTGALNASAIGKADCQPAGHLSILSSSPLVKKTSRLGAVGWTFLLITLLFSPFHFFDRGTVFLLVLYLLRSPLICPFHFVSAKSKTIRLQGILFLCSGFKCAFFICLLLTFLSA